MEKIISVDKNIFIFLNSLGSPEYDSFWLFITKQVNWIPFYLGIAYLLYIKLGIKKLGIILITISLMLVFTDQFTNLIKNMVQRSRPCNDSSIKHMIRIVQQRNSYSFFSGHAANSMAAMMFVFLFLKKYYKWSFLLFLFPLIFAYSRIYLGLHSPLDILTGYAFGALSGLIFYQIYKKLTEKLLPN